MDNKSISYTRWKSQYHIAFIPKYLCVISYCKLLRYTYFQNIKGILCLDGVNEF